jgi:hypothetical protein
MAALNAAMVSFESDTSVIFALISRPQEKSGREAIHENL